MITRDKLRAIGGLERYSDQELDLLLTAGVSRSFAPGQDLCVQGAEGTACFVVLDGLVDIVKATDEGERCIATVSAGAIVGQLALVGRGRRTATLRAKDPVSVLVIERSTYEHLLQAYSPLALRFQQQIATSAIRQLRSAVARLSSVLESGSGQRVGESSPPASVRPGGSHSPPPISGRPPPLSPRDEVQRYLQSTAEELPVFFEDPAKIKYVRETTPKTKGPR